MCFVLKQNGIKHYHQVKKGKKGERVKLCLPIESDWFKEYCVCMGPVPHGSSSLVCGHCAKRLRGAVMEGKNPQSCQVCHKLGVKLKCVGCGTAWHVKCMSPKPRSAKDDAWVCPLCYQRCAVAVRKIQGCEQRDSEAIIRVRRQLFKSAIGSVKTGQVVSNSVKRKRSDVPADVSVKRAQSELVCF